MTNSIIVDVAIGLALMYLVLAMFCTVIQEWISSWFDLRGKNLVAAITHMLGSSSKDQPSAEAKKALDHPLFAALSRPSSSDGAGKPPSYLPAAHFVQVVISILQPARQNEKITFPELRQSVANVTTTNKSLGDSLTAILDTVEGDIDKAIKGIEAWYDATMDRAVGWYKRQIAPILFFIGLALAAITNADTIQVAAQLSADKALRDRIAAHAALIADPSAEAAKASKEFKEKLAQNMQNGDLISGFGGLPLGWDRCLILASDGKLGEPSTPAKDGKLSESSAPTKDSKPGESSTPAKDGKESKFSITACYGAKPGGWLENCILAWLAKIVGLLMTASLASLGAPLWFELLQKLNAIRSAGLKPKDRRT